MTEKQLLLIGSVRCGKSLKYNRINKSKAIDICSRTLRPNKPLFIPLNCQNDCYYFDGRCELGFDGRCELGRTDGLMCGRYKNDVSFSNIVHKAILYDYDWCIEHLHLFCQLDKECFVAIYGKVNEDGMIKVRKEYGDVDD